MRFSVLTADTLIDAAERILRRQQLIEHLYLYLLDQVQKCPPHQPFQINEDLVHAWLTTTAEAPLLLREADLNDEPVVAEHEMAGRTYLLISFTPLAPLEGAIPLGLGFEQPNAQHPTVPSHEEQLHRLLQEAQEKIQSLSRFTAQPQDSASTLQRTLRKYEHLRSEAEALLQDVPPLLSYYFFAPAKTTPPASPSTTLH